MISKYSPYRNRPVKSAGISDRSYTRGVDASEEHLPATLDYYDVRERWMKLGKRIQALAAEARKMGVPLDVMPGAPGLIGDFKALGRRLDGLAR